MQRRPVLALGLAAFLQASVTHCSSEAPLSGKGKKQDSSKQVSSVRQTVAPAADGGAAGTTSAGGTGAAGTTTGSPAVETTGTDGHGSDGPSTDAAVTDGAAPLFVPLGGAIPLATDGASVADPAIASLFAGTLTGSTVGTTSVTSGGKTMSVVVYDPANPPAGATAAASDPNSPVNTRAIFQTHSEYFGRPFADMFYVASYTPVGFDAGNNPIAEVSHDAEGKAINYYYDNSAVFLWKPNMAPCEQPIRFASCSNVANGQHHFLTANVVGTTGNNSWCVSGSAVANALVAQAIFPVEQPGVLGDICNLKPDGSCPAKMRPLYWGMIEDNGKKSSQDPSATSILTSDLPHLLVNGAIVVSGAAPAGCGPFGN